MNKNFSENESIPHQKPGKNQNKPSPNQHGCEKNDHQEHDYQVINFYTARMTVSSNIQKRVRYANKIYGSKRYACVFCGKFKKRGNNGLSNKEPFTNILKYIHDNEITWHEVNVRADTMSLDLVSKIDW